MLSDKKSIEPGSLHKEQTIAVGRHPVLDALRLAPETVDQVFLQQGLKKDRGRFQTLCQELGIRFKVVPRHHLDKMAGTANHQGVAATLYLPGFTDADELVAKVSRFPLPLILALDQVQDPGNIGVMARTLLALGGAGLVVPAHRSAFLGAGAMKASAGALSRIAVSQVVNLSRFLRQCKESGLWIYGSGTGGESVPVFEESVRLPCVLVLGNEEKGLRPGVAKQCDRMLSIPMSGDIDSLNVAQAAAILMGEMVRQKNSSKFEAGSRKG